MDNKKLTEAELDAIAMELAGREEERKWMEDVRNPQVTMFHRRKAPNGKIFRRNEVPALEIKGWVDSPSKIKKDIRDKLGDVMKTIFAFWCKEYKWILGFIAMLITLYLTYLKVTTLNK